MKQIFIIESSADVLNTVKHYLKESDLNYVAFQSVREALLSLDLPEIIILFGSNNVLEIEQDISQIKNNQSCVRVPKILILPFNTTINQDKSKVLDVQETFCIPVDKLKFQSTISKFLMQAPRRIFRIIITILLSDSNIRYSGVSIDFSESGMAFECNSDLPVGKHLQISFVNPKKRNRILLNAEIARKTPTLSGSSIFYGVMFKDLSDKDTQDLSAFISGSS